jgi:hypothetical protein
LLARIIPIIVVGGVDTFGIRGDYSQGLPEELTVSAVGGVVCASEEGGTHTSMWQGTSFGERLSKQNIFQFLVTLDTGI